MTQKSKDKAQQPDANLDELSIDRPRLTPRASVDPTRRARTRPSPAAA